MNFSRSKYFREIRIPYPSHQYLRNCVQRGNVILLSALVLVITEAKIIIHAKLIILSNPRTFKHTNIWWAREAPTEIISRLRRENSILYYSMAAAKPLTNPYDWGLIFLIFYSWMYIDELEIRTKPPRKRWQLCSCCYYSIKKPLYMYSEPLII